MQELLCMTNESDRTCVLVNRKILGYIDKCPNMISTNSILTNQLFSVCYISVVNLYICLDIHPAGFPSIMFLDEFEPSTGVYFPNDLPQQIVRNEEPSTQTNKSVDLGKKAHCPSGNGAKSPRSAQLYRVRIISSADRDSRFP